jgi:hypothetical protein
VEVKGPFKPEYYRYWLTVYLFNWLIEAPRVEI